MYQEVVQLGEGACSANQLGHAGNGLMVAVEVGGLSVTSKEHVGKVGCRVENWVSTGGESIPNGKGASVPLSLPFVVEVALAAWAEPYEEAGSEALSVSCKLPPRREEVLLKRSGAVRPLSLEVGSPKLDNNDIWALFGLGVEGVHGGLDVVQKEVWASVDTKVEGDGVETC